MKIMKKNYFKFASVVIVIGVFALIVYRASNREDAPAPTAEKTPTKVALQSAADSQKYSYVADYPATTASQNQATVTASSNGTVQSLNFAVGETVRQGQRLATIDNTGGFSDPGKFGLESGQIRSMELAVESAEDAYKQAKRVYKKDDSYLNKKSRDIAKNNLLSAEATLQGALDSQYVTAPIAGTIVKKEASVGDSIAAGQVVAVISKTNKIKVTFYVNADELAYIKKGQAVVIHTDDNEIAGSISLIAPEADPTTKRFLVEATPSDNDTLPIGSLVSVHVEITQMASDTNHYIVPLSALTVGHNDTPIFIAADKTAKKVPVTVHKINGETAEISSDHIDAATQLVFDGGKFLEEGDKIEQK